MRVLNNETGSCAGGRHFSRCEEGLSMCGERRGSSTLPQRFAALFRGENSAYYLAFFLHVFWIWLDRTTLWDMDTSPVASIAEKLVQVLVLLLLAWVFVHQRATRREWMFALMIGVIGFIVWRTAKEGWLFWIALFVICGKGVRLKPLALLTFVSVAAVMLFAAVASNTGLIENQITMRTSNGVIRNPMGFAHPNSFGAALLVACMSLVPLVPRKRCVVLAIPCLAAALLSLLVADSRTSFLCLFAVAVALFVYSAMLRKHVGRKTGLLLLLLVIAAAVVSFGYMVFFDPARPLDALLDRALSGRLRLAHTYYLDHSPSLFGYDYANGTPYWANGEEYTFVVDNMFAHVLLRYGVIACVAFLSGLLALCAKMMKEGYFGPALFGMVLFIAYGLSETLGCRVDCNFYIISLWTVLYHRPISDFDDSDGLGASTELGINAPKSDVVCSSGSGVEVIDCDGRMSELSFRSFVMAPIRAVGSRRG